MNFFEKHVAFINCVAFDELYVGYRSYSNQSMFGRNTRIGRYCSIGRGCTINASSHPGSWLSTHPMFFDATYSELAQPWSGSHTHVTIGNDVWIGDNVSVLGGVTIGDGAIVGAGCVVTKDVPAYSVFVGVPGKVARPRFDEALVDALRSLRWWDYEEKLVEGLPYSNVEKCVAIMQERVSSGEYHRLQPHFERVRKAR